MTWWQRYVPPGREIKSVRPFPLYFNEFRSRRVLQRANGVEVLDGWHDSLQIDVLDRNSGEHRIASRAFPGYSRVGELAGVRCSYAHSASPIPPTVELRMHKRCEVLATRCTHGNLHKYLSFTQGTKQARP